ncbi:MAG: energy transducer TonB [Bacteroidetes bacterium]|nr:energy transducer TonB [Bacteroidota bacterium]
MAILLAFLILISADNLSAQTSTPASPLSEPAVVKRYFERAMHYPEQALSKGIKGKVTVSLEVLPDGSTRNYHIVKGLDHELDQEALRLAKHILWKPAEFAGTPITSSETLTIDFNPKTYLKNRQKTTARELWPGDDDSIPGVIYSPKQLTEAPQAILPEGFRSLSSYITHLMKYPEMAVRHNISGTVVLAFVVETNGLASNIRVKESVGGGCDQEAIRILEQIAWKAGRRAGESVRSHAELEIVFRLKDSMQRAIPNQRSTGL